MYRRFPTRTLLVAIVALIPGAMACEDFEGVPAPADVLHFPVGLALHPDGRYLYVVNSNFDVTYGHDRGGTVTVIDTDTLQLLPNSTVFIGSFGGRAVLTEDARYLFVAVRGDNSVVRLDVSEDGSKLSCQGGNDGLPCRIRGLAADPYALAVDTLQANLEVGGETRIDMVVVSHLNANDITAISMKEEDLATAARLSSRIIAGGSGLAVNPRNGLFYVTGRFAAEVRSFRPVIGREGDIAAIYALSTIALANPAGHYDGRDIAFTADGNRAFVAARNPNSVLVIDTSPEDRETGGGSRDEVVDQIDLETAPEALAMVEGEDGETLYLLEFEGDELTVIDPNNHLVLDSFPVGDGPAELAVDSERHQRIYVSLFREAAIGVIDLDPESRRYRSLVAKIR